ncbi:MAG TPA: 2OG-Fe(II) oxygenase [Terriglobia bacterium]|nr:2OG-Fe(II) oxygenase [Terriglobia bacterium]
MIQTRFDEINWEEAARSLTEDGFAELPQILSSEECRYLSDLYQRADLFRSRVDMLKFRFGRGEYQYFRYPLPPVVEELRQLLYGKLVNVANKWADFLDAGGLFPATLNELLDFCRQKGQVRPTPLLLSYKPGDFNCLHQDVYGQIAFPFQVVFFLSEPGKDYWGGEFLLVEQAPRSQAMGRSLTPRQGQGLVITTRHRPAQGKRGWYKVGVRHGVSPVTAGSRYTLGIIFHDAQ